MTHHNKHNTATQAFPGRAIVQVDLSQTIKYQGGLHCLSKHIFEPSDALRVSPQVAVDVASTDKALAASLWIGSLKAGTNTDARIDTSVPASFRTAEADVAVHPAYKIAEATTMAGAWTRSPKLELRVLMGRGKYRVRKNANANTNINAAFSFSNVANVGLGSGNQAFGRFRKNSFGALGA
jgi:hypothetical protein